MLHCNTPSVTVSNLVLNLYTSVKFDPVSFVDISLIFSLSLKLSDSEAYNIHNIYYI